MTEVKGKFAKVKKTETLLKTEMRTVVFSADKEGKIRLNCSAWEDALNNCSSCRFDMYYGSVPVCAWCQKPWRQKAARPIETDRRVPRFGRRSFAVQYLKQ